MKLREPKSREALKASRRSEHIVDHQIRGLRNYITSQEKTVEYMLRRGEEEKAKPLANDIASAKNRLHGKQIEKDIYSNIAFIAENEIIYEGGSRKSDIGIMKRYVKGQLGRQNKINEPYYEKLDELYKQLQLAKGVNEYAARTEEKNQLTIEGKDILDEIKQKIRNEDAAKEREKSDIEQRIKEMAPA